MRPENSSQTRPRKSTRWQRSAAWDSQARTCRFCRHPIHDLVIDLGLSPLCQGQVSVAGLNQPETFFPLQAFTCRNCWLMQVDANVSGEEIFSHYAYFSSFSTSWLQHCEAFVNRISDTLTLGSHSHVVELASNDGYLLQYFVQRQIPCLGIEPASNVAETARRKGIPVVTRFFGVDLATELAGQGRRADLLIANNVLAHVPDLCDFVAGMKILLAPTGLISIEVPHLQRLLEENQFDTIYQEHYCYFLLNTLVKLFAAHDLEVVDVEPLSTHGGSLRVSVRHAGSESKVADSVSQTCQREIEAGMQTWETYLSFEQRAREVKYDLLNFLIAAKRAGQLVVGYGAPGKGNTLLNYCGIREDLLAFTVDRNPVKQNHFLVGSRIPVYPPEAIAEVQPDFILVLPWNLRTEIQQQLSYVRQWDAKFIFAIPKLEVV